MEYLAVAASIPGAKGVVIGLLYGSIKSRSFNPLKAIREIGWIDYLSGYASGFIGGWLIFS